MIEQNTTQLDFLTKKINRLERIIVCMSVAFACIFFISFTHKRNDTFGELKVERLQIVDGDDTVLDIGTYQDTSNYRTVVINGYAGRPILSKVFQFSGNGNLTNSGHLRLYDNSDFFAIQKNVIDIGQCMQGGFIDFYDSRGILSKSIKAE